MNWTEILWLIAFVITHVAAYCWGVSNKPEPFKPTNEAWVAVQCHAIDKGYEHQRWLHEHNGSAESSN